MITLAAPTRSGETTTYLEKRPLSQQKWRTAFIEEMDADFMLVVQRF